MRSSIRALQLADLRTRRLCGRHQITSEGKHLIDGVPFGSPFLKRSTTTRPAITIPPRKRRRTVFSGWEHGPDISAQDALDDGADEEGDGEWVPPPQTGFGKELSIMPPEHEESMGTVIRHPIDRDEESESEGDMSEVDEDEGGDDDDDENELESELQALKEDFEEASQFVDIRNQTRNPSGPALRATSVSKRPTSKGSIAAASTISSKRSREEDSSPRTSKAVRFNKGGEGTPELPQAELPEAQEPAVEPKLSAPEPAPEPADSSDSDSDSDDDSDSSSDSDSSDDDDASSSEVEPAKEAVVSNQESSSDSSSDSDSSDSSDSDSEDEAPPAPPAPKVQPPPVTRPPGDGSIRTKKSNNRLKLRRRLSKLKELGALPDEADFDALRSWEDTNGSWFTPEQSFVADTTPAKPETGKSEKQLKKEQEQQEFEARRQKLLRDLASGNGVDVDQGSEKENVPPLAPAAEAPEAPVSEQVPAADKPDEESSKEAAHRRTLDVASSRRMLFGSLGMRTPKTKEEEEQTRQKLAAKAKAREHQKRPSQTAEEDVDQMDEDEDEDDGDWMNKLVIRAVECVYPEVAISAPPYPFVQRWDKDANALIREKKGPTKKRKRKQRIQVYNNEEEEYDENGNWYGDGYYEGDDQEHHEHAADSYYNGHYAGEAEDDHQLNYDEGPEPEPAAPVEDLPVLPEDMSTVPDLTEKDVKVGAIIAFRQLDMSKATNWQPQMSDYRVAEVRSVKEKGDINVLLAKRDRKQRSVVEDDELRQFSKYEVPDLANDEEEDDGYRELAFAELSDPKLLQPAKSDEGQNTSEGSMSVN